MSRRRQLTAAAVLLTAGLFAAPVAAADTQHVVTLDEQDCREVVTYRPVRTDQLRPLVPERYDLTVLNATASRSILTTYTCETVAVDGQPTTAGGPAQTVVSLWSAGITARDGVPTTGSYLLSYTTNNPVMFAKLQRTGLPVHFAPDSEVTVEPGETTSTLTFTVRGALDYDLTAVSNEPGGSPSPSTGTWYHDGPSGDIRIEYHNDALPVSTAAITADFTRIQPMASMAVTTLTPVNAFAYYIRGSWFSEIEYLE